MLKNVGIHPFGLRGSGSCAGGVDHWGQPGNWYPNLPLWSFLFRILNFHTCFYLLTINLFTLWFHAFEIRDSFTCLRWSEASKWDIASCVYAYSLSSVHSWPNFETCQYSVYHQQTYDILDWFVTCRRSTCKTVCLSRSKADSVITETIWVGACQIRVSW
jgi:hypothetical protein